MAAIGEIDAEKGRCDADAGLCAAALSTPAERLIEGAARRTALGLVGVAAVAWVALYLWASSDAAVYLDHGSWLTLGLYEALCLWAGDLGAVGVFAGVAAWVLMLVAMMLPTTAPMMTQIARKAADGRERFRALSAAAAGYLALWTVFGAAAHGLDLAFHTLADQVAWLQIHGWTLGAATVALAGLYQFTPLKDACRAACRAPLADLASDAPGGPGLSRRAFRAGVSHGLACLGCCWALMLLMFVVGMGNLAWMLGLTLLMAAEKNLARGADLSAPIGLSLLAAAAALVGANI